MMMGARILCTRAAASARKFYCSSALYVTGDKAQDSFVFLTPHIDFGERIQNRQELLDNIQARKLCLNLERIEQRWDFYRMMDDHKTILDFTRSELYGIIKKLKEEPERNKGDIEKCLVHLQQVKDDLKNLKEYSYGIEENACTAVLGLPNVLHPKTPVGSCEVIHEFLSKPSEHSKSHLELGHDLIELHSPMFYYLKSEAALFEFAVTNYFSQALRNSNYTNFSNASFARSIIVEGCGVPYLDNTKIFTLADPHNDKTHEISRLHLVGGSSLYSYMAYFAKNILQKSYFPLNLFSVGKNYQPNCENSDLNLRNLSQYTAVKTFVATVEDSAEVSENLQSIIQQVIKLYEPLGYHFRLVYLPAHELSIAESLRVSIQMFSNHSQSYVEVGNVSFFDEYLGKRLMFICSLPNKEQRFVKVISGDLLNVQKLLSCALENNASASLPLLRDVLKNHL